MRIAAPFASTTASPSARETCKPHSGIELPAGEGLAAVPLSSGCPVATEGLEALGAVGREEGFTTGISIFVLERGRCKAVVTRFV